MIDILDMHTHTIASGHAYNTIDEMARAAKEKGIKALGITEHAPEMPGTCHMIYFQNLRVLPRTMYGVEMFFGAELNIIDYDGGVDIPDNILKEFDICIASVHIPCLKDGGKEANTNAVIGAMKNPYVNIIGHPDDGRFELDYEKIVKAAKDYHVLLELNNSSVAPKAFRVNARENILMYLELCRQYEVSVIMDSDAHCMYDVGNHTYISEIVKQINFPDELIVNNSVEKLKEFLKRK